MGHVVYTIVGMQSWWWSYIYIMQKANMLLNVGSYKSYGSPFKKNLNHFGFAFKRLFVLSIGVFIMELILCFPFSVNVFQLQIFTVIFTDKKMSLM